MTSPLQFTQMTVDELSMVLDWAADEGWNPGLADAEAFHAADPGGFFLARLDDTPIAAISVVNHDPRNAFLGLYICRPSWRGQGVGLQLWAHALSHAGSRSVGLDGVPAQEANYRSSGFVRVGASLRHEGRWHGKVPPAIRPASHRDLTQLIALDAQAGGFARPAFLTAWVSRSDGLRGTQVIEQDGEIAGCATWRACRDGTKIGPVLGATTGTALDLIASIARLRADGPLIIDLPEGNGDLRGELERAGFSIPFATARMYRGPVPEIGPNLQAIATMELG